MYDTVKTIGLPQIKKLQTLVDSDQIWIRNKSSSIYDTGAWIYRPSFRENKPKRSFSTIENECFGLFSRKLGL